MNMYAAKCTLIRAAVAAQQDAASDHRMFLEALDSGNLASAKCRQSLAMFSALDAREAMDGLSQVLEAERKLHGIGRQLGIPLHNWEEYA